ncbi:hypothetical protein P9027_26320 [Bacillus thuringiensis]|uniref:hypothetical protein n=1 Tax=Bacillus thuringiensis TaxID=1428 RepID=UPI002DB77037|nr:hypothetical protein [Bacillus thuringiensis]MEC3225468.1 hypothetical protein [Bacillus thuringiensis]MEC3465316.1 hypothetical protein [Bacillus thuringiensis]
MLDKLKNHFKDVNLVCSQCGKTIEQGEQFEVSLVLPEEKNMPVGQLDKVLAKRANEILCNKCRKS